MDNIKKVKGIASQKVPKIKVQKVPKSSSNNKVFDNYQILLDNFNNGYCFK